MRLLITKGKRPSLENFRVPFVDQKDNRRLLRLMEKCWRASPTQRPSSLECTKITEKLYQRQKRGINDAVHEVLKKLREQKE
ncbi:unnamed protein product [Pleuronectes platessa]|uniref:Uncharacterized protein n=1 Tax=Pleuronectes platessa TaxID=8262 RepID=A0A9N7UVA5_PLEPL|nr:unnamed protein product [Pleuronectes platessa]